VALVCFRCIIAIGQIYSDDLNKYAFTKGLKLERIVAHPIFAGSVRALDVLQRAYMRALAYLSPIKDCRTVFGAIVRCNARDFVQRRIRFFEIFEHNLTYYTMERLREGDVYLDIGANIGYFSLLASRCVGNSGEVISVEADPVTFTGLMKNLELNGCRNVSARNIAATETACKIGITRGDPYNSGCNAITVGTGAENVEGLPFRDIVGEDIGRVRFIKIDIEGSEAPILSAILEVLPDLPDDLIVASEVSPASADQVARFTDAGFRAYAMQNIYTIDYYLIRSYLRKFGEDKSIQTVPVSRYDPRYTDYIFERGRSFDA
jgi:FkbM family methyltransferase